MVLASRGRGRGRGRVVRGKSATRSGRVKEGFLCAGTVWKGQQGLGL